MCCAYTCTHTRICGFYVFSSRNKMITTMIMMIVKKLYCNLDIRQDMYRVRGASPPWPLLYYFVKYLDTWLLGQTSLSPHTSCKMNCHNTGYSGGIYLPGYFARVASQPRDSTALLYLWYVSRARMWGTNHVIQTEIFLPTPIEDVLNLGIFAQAIRMNKRKKMC
jgi:hypothetical protein